MEGDLLEHMENDLDLAKVNDYLKQAQAQEIARERFMQATARSPWATGVKTNWHDPEHNENLDNWR
eukprot:5056627-Karenia_brevis.AAC.1